MRAAPPPVQVMLGRGSAQRWFAGLLVAAATASVIAWLIAHQAAGPLALLAVPLATALAAWRSAPRPALLCWDGAGWSLQCPSGAAPQPAAVQLSLDLGAALVLRCRLPGERRWRAWWLGRAEAGAAWHPLRVALAHRGASAAGPVAP